MGTNRFWFLDHSSHSNIRIPFQTSYRPGFFSVVQPSIKPSSNPVFPVVVQCCVGLGGYPVVGRQAPTCPYCYLPLACPYTDIGAFVQYRHDISTSKYDRLVTDPFTVTCLKKDYIFTTPVIEETILTYPNSYMFLPSLAYPYTNTTTNHIINWIL